MKRSHATVCRTRSAQPLRASFEWHKQVIYFGLDARNRTPLPPVHAGTAALVDGASEATGSGSETSSSSCMKRNTRSQRRNRTPAGNRSRSRSKK